MAEATRSENQVSAETSSGKDAPDTEWKKSGARFTSKRNSEYFDPCQEAANRSLKCLRRNGGDRKMCTDYFDAYKDCKKAWVSCKSSGVLVINWKSGADVGLDGGNEGGETAQWDWLVLMIAEEPSLSPDFWEQIVYTNVRYKATLEGDFFAIYV